LVSERGSLASHRSLTPATIGSLLTLVSHEGAEHTLTECLPPLLGWLGAAVRSDARAGAN
jgi:hypothetical protein